jgi:hypothetical protein
MQARGQARLPTCGVVAGLRASTDVAICTIPYWLAIHNFLFTSAPPANSTIKENRKV